MPFVMPWWSMNSLVFPFFLGIARAFLRYPPLLILGAHRICLRIHLRQKNNVSQSCTGEGKKPPINLAFLRNVTKICGLALLLDVVIALALPRRDPTRKYTDTFAGTIVVVAD